MTVVFGHARLRISILGIAGFCLGLLMIWQSKDMRSCLAHRGEPWNVDELSPARAANLWMFGLGSTLLAIGGGQHKNALNFCRQLRALRCGASVRFLKVWHDIFVRPVPVWRGVIP